MRYRAYFPSGNLVAALTGCGFSEVQTIEQQAQAFQVGKATYPEFIAGFDPSDTGRPA